MRQCAKVYFQTNGDTEWVINSSNDVAGLTCGGTEQDSAGVKTYFLYYINGTSLQFGTSTADNVTSLDSETYTKQ